METNTNGGGFVDRERYGGGRAAESHGRATLRWVAAQSRTGRRQKGRQQRSSQRHLLLECESEGFTVWVCRLLGLAGVGALCLCGGGGEDLPTTGHWTAPRVFSRSPRIKNAGFGIFPRGASLAHLDDERSVRTCCGAFELQCTTFGAIRATRTRHSTTNVQPICSDGIITATGTAAYICTTAYAIAQDQPRTLVTANHARHCRACAFSRANRDCCSRSAGWCTCVGAGQRTACSDGTATASVRVSTVSASRNSPSAAKPGWCSGRSGRCRRGAAWADPAGRAQARRLHRRDGCAAAK
jgi:hypothetical protein